MHTSKKKKAFTLTELLVVIVIAGVLAAVALPKFNAVVETRRTGEAEELASAIRNEQERRCALDQSYSVHPNQIGVAGVNTANATFNKGSFEYTLNETGLIARRTDKDYKLVMPSYKDGRMYCEGEYCAKLNKNYPQSLTDLREAEECAAPIGEEGGQTACEQDPNSCECNPNQAKCCASDEYWNGTKCVKDTPCERDPESCECNPNQAKCCKEGEVWENGKCVTPSEDPTQCSNEHYEGEPTTEFSLNNGGGQFVVDSNLKPALSGATMSANTNNNLVVGGGTGNMITTTPNTCNLDECPTVGYYWHCGADTDYQWEKQKDTKCEKKPSKTEPCEDIGNRKASGDKVAKYTCTSSGWSMDGWDSSACRYTCDESAKPEVDPNKTMTCNYCGKAVIQYECDDTTGKWKEVGGPCSKTKEECGYVCGTAKEECKAGDHDYKSGKECAPGKGHPGDLVTRTGSNCTLAGGYMCYRKASSDMDISATLDPNGGSSNQNITCECPSAFWSGRYCNELCHWVNERCSTSSSGGGGGGGSMRGGCSTSMVVDQVYRDATGQYHYTYAYKTTCDGEI